MQLGLHLRGRFDRVFELERCHLQSESSNRILQAVRRHARAAGLAVYNLRTHEGLLRFLVVREGKRSGQILVNLVVSAYPCAAVDRLAEELLKEVPAISVFIVTLHQGRAQVASGQAEYILKGAGHIVEECRGLQFEISSQSFFQTNSLQAERLCDILKGLAVEAQAGKILDLYCGTGGMGLCLAAAARHVLGVEVAAEAVEDARRNAVRNGIGNCDFVAGSVEEVLEELCAAGRCFDLVVADPPRAGMHRRVLVALGVLEVPVLIYVSCNLLSLAADLESLGALGYAIEVVQPVDMFPQTPHCELVVRLRRRRGGH